MSVRLRVVAISAVQNVLELLSIAVAPNIVLIQRGFRISQQIVHFSCSHFASFAVIVATLAVQSGHGIGFCPIKPV